MKEFVEKLIGRLEEHCAIKNNVCDCDGVCSECDFKASIEIVNELAEEYNNGFCEWTQDDKEIDVYYTKCGQAHIFIDGNPEENNHVYCPYCGKKIKVAPYQPKGE